MPTPAPIHDVSPQSTGESVADADRPLEVAIARTGEQLLDGLTAALDAVPDAAQGPQQLARRLGVDKVLASRVLKAMRSSDPMSVMHRIPGPEPLRRLIRGLARQGVDNDLIARAQLAVDAFEQLIRSEFGDRSALDTIISAWVPEARREFQLRRKQSAFKAMSQLKGAQAQTIVATVILNPSDDGEHIDIVWISGLIGLHRTRPGAGVKLVTRRVTNGQDTRQPCTLHGTPITDHEHVRLAEFCSTPLPELRVVPAGEAVHYFLADERFGPNTAVDLIFGELNFRELRRTVPRGSNRKGYVFAEVSTPAKVLQLDVLVHSDIYPDSEPGVRIYDTAFEGIADVNNPDRDIDLMDLVETVDTLGSGLSRFRSADVPRYAQMLATTFQSLNWDDHRFRGYRCRIEYPIYGTQVALTFDPPQR